jgi:alpha-N-arabinofuranosidase
MDTDQPFVGEHSPKILLDAATPHGIRQSGFSLVGGKQYTGRIYLRGTPGTKVSVTLSWGTGDSYKQTISFTVTRDFKKFPLSFNPKADSADAAFEISGTGSGDFHIGAVSRIPARHHRAAQAASLRHVAPARRQLSF